MTAQSDPYVRVYYRIVDDPKFEDVYDDKPTLGWWLTLLLAADASHPAPANLPRRLPKATLNRLVSAGLVDLIGSDRFRIHGLSAEREQRSEHARRAARAKHEQSSPAAISEPNRTEPIRTAPLRHGATGLTPIGEILSRAKP